MKERQLLQKNSIHNRIVYLCKEILIVSWGKKHSLEDVQSKKTIGNQCVSLCQNGHKVFSILY